MTPEDIDVLYGATWFQQGAAMRRPPTPTPDLVYLFARNVEKFVLQEAASIGKILDTEVKL